MKLKLLVSSMLMAGALISSGTASAFAVPWEWSGTMADWQNANYNGNPAGAIVDISVPAPNTGLVTTGAASGDNDTTFTFLNNTTSGGTGFNPNTAGVKLSEQLSPSGVDIYGVNVSFGVAATSGLYGYSISTTEPQGLNTARLDTTTLLGSITNNSVSKYLYSNSTDYNNALTCATVACYLTNALMNPALNSINSISAPSAGLAAFPTQQTFYVLDVINSGALTNINNQYSITPRLEQFKKLQEIVVFKLLGRESQLLGFCVGIEKLFCIFENF